MGCLGVHFSLDEQIVNELRSYKRESARLNYVQEKLEEGLWEKRPELGCETDKSWDAIHRTLTDGDLAWRNGQYPLNHVILGGELLYTKQDYISLKTPQQVQDAAAALRGLTFSRRQTLRVMAGDSYAERHRSFLVGVTFRASDPVVFCNFSRY
jgi:hypothetical protein